MNLIHPFLRSFTYYLWEYEQNINTPNLIDEKGPEYEVTEC